jgi:replicative DNA helicase
MSEQILGNAPPHSLEAEQSVLGAIMLDKNALETAINKLKNEYFYFDANREIFEGAKSLTLKNQPVDLLTLSEELKRRKTLIQVGGVEYLAGLTENIATTRNAEAYCKIIEEKAIVRELIQAAEEIRSKGLDNSSESKALIELAESRIFAISQERQQRDFSHMRDIILDVFNLLEERSQQEGTMTGLTTGFREIDMMTAGLQKSDFILIAARPSMGKTALALNVAINSAIKGKASVAIFSLEMSKEQLVQRIVSMESLVESNKLRTGQLEDEDWDKITYASGIISDANIYIDDSPGITLFELASKCRRLKTQKGLDLIIIDYLQLMDGGGKESRQQEISNISRGLKGLAREMDCPVISLSQLSRAPEQRQNHRPILSDLRESGAIEQDADIVIFLYRDEYYHDKENQEDENYNKRGIAEVIIAKHRNGPVGTVELSWVDRFTKFTDLPK